MPSAQAQTVAIPKRWPLVTPFAARSSQLTNPAQDARIINGYLEKDLTDGEFWIQKRMGLSSTIYTTGGPGRGMWPWVQSIINVPVLVVVAGGMVYALNYYHNVATFASIGPIGASDICRFCPIPSTAGGPLLIFGDGTPGVQPYYLTPTVLGWFTLAQINDPNYPPETVPGFAFLDGTVYVMDIYGGIWGSVLGNPIVWTSGGGPAAGPIYANADPDGGVFIAKQLTYIIAIKQWTTQFFYDNGNPTGSPLSVVPEAMLNYGCVSADTVQEIDGLLFWVTSNRTVSPQVLVMENLQPRFVSTPAIERVLDATNYSTKWSAFAFKHAGHRLYVLNIISNNQTLIYDIDESRNIGFHVWYQWTDPSGNYWPICAQAFDYLGNHCFQNATNGSVSYMDTCFVYPTDGGKMFPVDVYSANVDFGVNRWKMLSRMYFKADQVPGSTLQVRFSDNDYQSWSDFLPVDLGIDRPQLGEQGAFWRRAYNFRLLSNTSFRMKASDLQMDLGVL